MTKQEIKLENKEIAMEYYTKVITDLTTIIMYEPDEHKVMI